MTKEEYAGNTTQRGASRLGERRVVIAESRLLSFSGEVIARNGPHPLQALSAWGQRPCEKGRYRDAVSSFCDGTVYLYLEEGIGAMKRYYRTIKRRQPLGMGSHRACSHIRLWRKKMGEPDEGTRRYAAEGRNHHKGCGAADCRSCVRIRCSNAVEEIK